GFLAVALALGGLAAWYFRLQVLQHADYATRSEANRIRPRPVVPGRGMIYDRQGRLLAENVPAFRLDVVPDKAGDTERLLAELGQLIRLGEDEIEHFRRERKAGRGFRPITLKMRLSDEEMAAFAVNRWRFPGVEMEPYPTRHYPYGDLFAHVIGYVGRIDEKDLEQLGERGTALTHIGKTGIERAYEDLLRGQVGYEQIETNVQGRALRTVGRVPARPGSDLRLSIDAELQRATVAAFGELEGTAVAMDPRTGEILALVSLPSYDPNLFVNGISHADYRALMDNPSRPQFNRAVLGGVAPGSTLKPFLALAGPRTAPCPPACSTCPATAAAGATRTAAATGGPTRASRSPIRSTPTTTSWRWTWASSGSSASWSVTGSASPPASTWSARAAASCRPRRGRCASARSAGIRAIP